MLVCVIRLRKVLVIFLSVILIIYDELVNNATYKTPVIARLFERSC